MWYWIEYILDFIVHVVFFPYFIIRQYRADMKFLRSFKQEPRETLCDRISRNGGSFGELVDKEHPFLAKAMVPITPAAGRLGNALSLLHCSTGSIRLSTALQGAGASGSCHTVADKKFFSAVVSGSRLSVKNFF